MRCSQTRVYADGTLGGLCAGVCVRVSGRVRARVCGGPRDLRFHAGIAALGGMFVSTLVSLYFVPALYASGGANRS